MSTTRVIKKYANRKLYDTEQSKYVTIKDIVEQVSQGQTIMVVDNVTKEDITGLTLLNAIVENEKDYSGQVTTLSAILKAGGLTRYINNITQADTIKNG